MAELVDALVSNTSGFTSIPVRPRVWVLKIAVNHMIFSYFLWVAPQKISSGSQFRRMKSWVGHCSKSLMSSINLEQASRYLSSHFLNVAAFSRLIKISSCGYPFISTFNL